MSLREHLTELVCASRCHVPGCDCEVARLESILNMIDGWPPHAVAVLDELIDREEIASLLGQLIDCHAALRAVRLGEVEAQS